MTKVALFPFNGEEMCFIHVLLNGLDMQAKGYEVVVVVEGAAVALIPKLAREDSPMHGLYVKARDGGLFAGACKACSVKLGVLDGIKAEGFTLLDDMSGHASMSVWMDKGFEVITF